MSRVMKTIGSAGHRSAIGQPVQRVEYLLGALDDRRLIGLLIHIDDSLYPQQVGAGLIGEPFQESS